MEDNRFQLRFQNFDLAFHQLQEAVGRIAELDDLAKEGLIQRFEYTLELAWKCMKDYLEEQEVEAKFPKEVIRQAFRYEIIDDGELWLEMLSKRNLLAHTYNVVLFHEAIDEILNRYYNAILALHSYFQKVQAGYD
ncbi:nucleotidyltransferase substrate binding protein [Persicobacter sp. CCB-QB2]|uniref:nucleotidyltransferase substrate binding protein n=1 Tax=Persicobacter sp. CCB-QB2 TaxID=1561025 RepID=UPI0006A9B85E|nr:nucleotidyltransferase substrate binding protein [Persicobacter sp. CCB-QB2]